MAFMLMIVLTNYTRPCEVFRIKRGQLVPPFRGATTHWMLLNPEELKQPSKMAIFDDSIDLSNKMVPWMMHLVEAAAAGPRDENVFSFSYEEFAREFRRLVKRLRLTTCVPYQTRHSGASIDVSNRWRPLPEVKKRGRW